MTIDRPTFMRHSRGRAGQERGSRRADLTLSDKQQVASARPGAASHSPDRGVYAISVVSELTGVQPHTLRAYERAGLLKPARTRGGNRLYSDNDLDRLRRIGDLAATGLNFAGIRAVLELEQANQALREELEQLRSQVESTRSDPDDADERS
ncbi:MAG TPA: MerR family transcriptional regulator [Actinopolymorphaceae bacterium]|jgi:DNA-binding transcriptional MerR regulator